MLPRIGFGWIGRETAKLGIFWAIHLQVLLIGIKTKHFITSFHMDQPVAYTIIQFQANDFFPFSGRIRHSNPNRWRIASLKYFEMKHFPFVCVSDQIQASKICMYQTVVWSILVVLYYLSASESRYRQICVVCTWIQACFISPVCICLSRLIVLAWYIQIWQVVSVCICMYLRPGTDS